MNTLVWLIHYSSNGERRSVVHTHNAIDDYRVIDPDAEVTCIDCAAVTELIDFLRDADCHCREATDRYEAHNCRRCQLLARVSGGAR